MILHIDPGTAFGTGMHETTQLVIRQLKKYVTRGAEILDVGTGSGILGITALKLGAGHVVGTDLDPCAVSAVQDNKEANQIEDDTFDMMIGNIIDDVEVQNEVGYERYDIVSCQHSCRCACAADTGDRSPDEKGCILYHFRYSGCQRRGCQRGSREGRTYSGGSYKAG